MRNQGHHLKAQQPKSLSLKNQYKIRRTELILAISSWPFSNEDDYHDTYHRRSLVQAYANQPPKIHHAENHNGQTTVPVALTDGFMQNQGHHLKAQQPKSFSLHNQYKIRRTELILAIASRPFSNADDYHDTHHRRTLVQAYANQPPKIHHAEIHNGQTTVPVALTDSFM
jgi:nitrate reductase cytochrome c-type subunit